MALLHGPMAHSMSVCIQLDGRFKGLEIDTIVEGVNK